MPAITHAAVLLMHPILVPATRCERRAENVSACAPGSLKACASSSGYRNASHQVLLPVAPGLATTFLHPTLAQDRAACTILSGSTSSAPSTHGPRSKPTTPRHLHDQLKMQLACRTCHSWPIKATYNLSQRLWFLLNSYYISMRARHCVRHV